MSDKRKIRLDPETLRPNDNVRMLRGGCGVSKIRYCRASFRMWYLPVVVSRCLGVRLALEDADEQPQKDPA